MTVAEIIEILKRRRSEAKERQIGFAAREDKDNARISGRIKDEYEELIAEIELSGDDLPEIVQGNLTRQRRH